MKRQFSRFRILLSLLGILTIVVHPTMGHAASQVLPPAATDGDSSHNLILTNDHHCPLVDCFETYYDIVHSYKTVIDTLTMECPKAEWATRFERIQGYHKQYYTEVGNFMHSIDTELRNHSRADMAFYSDTLTLRTVLSDKDFVDRCSHLLVFKMCWELYTHQSEYQFDDVRMLTDIIESVLPDFELRMAHSEVTLASYSLLAQAYGDMTHQMIEQYAQENVYYLKKVQEFDDRFTTLSCPDLKKMVLNNYGTLLDVNLLMLDALTPEEAYGARDKVMAFLAKHSRHLADAGLGSEAGKAYNRCRSYPIRALSNYVLRTRWEAYDPQVRETAQKVLQRLERNQATLQDREVYFMYNLKVYLGIMTPEAAWAKAYDYYKAHPLPTEGLGLSGLKQNADAVASLTFMLDKTPGVPGNERKEAVTGFLDAMVHSLEANHLSKFRSQIATVAARLLKDPMLFQGLDDDVRHAYIHKLICYTHTRSLCFSQQAARVGLRLLKYAMKDHPECFVGMNGCRTPQDIVQDKELQLHIKQRYLEGALVHDLGYNSIIDVVKNDYRPLTSKEFDIMTLHCERGMEYLNVDPDLHSFKDFALGHHKWYNSKRGYPSWFSLQTSKDKFLLDVLYLSEFLSFPLSGNGKIYYDEMFRFDALMEYIDPQSGTRFNPVLVKMIHDNKQLNKELRSLVEEGWKDIFYNIYSVYFPSFDPATFQMAPWINEEMK